MTKEFFQGKPGQGFTPQNEGELSSGAVLPLWKCARQTTSSTPFTPNRNFLYLTGVDQKETAFIARKDGQGQVTEKVFYILPPDWLAERWTESV